MNGCGPSAASPGESSHVVGFLLGGLDEAQKLQLRHGLDETGAGERVEERFFKLDCYVLSHNGWGKKRILLDFVHFPGSVGALCRCNHGSVRLKTVT